MKSASPPLPEPDWEGDFHEFWPVTLVWRRLPDHGAPTRALVTLAESMDDARRNLTTGYQGVDFFGIEDPGVAWLREQVNNTVSDYLEHHNIRYPVSWNIQGWPNINRLGDYHTPHNHGWCYLSGTYYACLPGAVEGLALHAEAAPAAITFYDPRCGAGLHVPEDDPCAQAGFTVHPEPGMLLLWHSAIMHLVHPNLSTDKRITISFNVVLEWANHYVANE